MTERRAYTAEERAVNARLDQHMKDARAGKAPTPHVENKSPLLRYIQESFGAPAETVDAGDDVRFSAAWLRLDQRTREECDSPVPHVKAAAQSLLRQYTEADPDHDPVARHYVEMARNAPRSAPEPRTSTQPVKEEAWCRARDTVGYGESIADRARELEVEITEERRAAAAAAAQEEAE